MVDDDFTGEVQEENELDDFNSIDLDIESLREKFILPIDQYRSRSAPNIFAEMYSNNNSGSLNETSLQESRTHAFYRVLGLPAIDQNGRYFNPGFNPKNRYQKEQADINKSISSLVKKATSQRELDARARFNIFNNESLNSSIYSVILGRANCQKRFMLMDKGIDSLNGFDPQKISKETERKKLISFNFKKKNGDDIDEDTYGNISHILRPFVTDPIICSEVVPKSGDLSVMVGVPFLENDDREYESGKYVKRPGLEFILRLRLRQQNILETAENYFNQIDLKTLDGEISIDRKRDIASVLSNIGVNDVDISRVLNGISALELYTLNDLVKTYKGLVYLYFDSIQTIEEVSKQIIWTPICNVGGPEMGSEVFTRYIIPKLGLDTWQIEHQITQLQVKNIFSKNQADIGDDILYSDFVISEYQNMNKIFSEELQRLENERIKLESDGSNALRIIEYIDGEVSGLGLIDILAVYMAMWSIDISILLDLLDDTSIERLNKISQLQTSAVEERTNRIGNVDINTSYKTFENRIMSILSYGDRLYNRALGTPLDDGGDIPRDV